MSDEEIAENERLWQEENQDNLDAAAQQPEMGAAGLSGAGITDDFGGLETELGDEGDAIDAGEGTPPEAATGDDIGGAEAAPTDQTV